MNKDNAKDYLPLVQAMAEGKTIQVFSNCEWHDAPNAIFNADPDYYRIKPNPKPVKLYVATWFDDSGMARSVVSYDKLSLARIYGHYRGFKLHELDCGEAP